MEEDGVAQVGSEEVILATKVAHVDVHASAKIAVLDGIDPPKGAKMDRPRAFEITQKHGAAP